MSGTCEVYSGIMGNEGQRGFGVLGEDGRLNSNPVTTSGIADVPSGKSR